nr:HK97 family phage prohead protease [Microbacterium bovistercoris]
MKIKNQSVRFKAGPEDGLAEGEFLVYPSTFTRTPDSWGDVVAKGAFLESIQAWKDSDAVMPGMYLHDPNQIVAAAVDMGEDDHGWWVKGVFDEDPAAQRIYRLVKGRRLTSLSFAYDTLEEGAVQLDDGTKANELRKLDALEFSFLPRGFAANEDTSVVAVKSAVDALLNGVKAGRVLSAKNEETLRAVVDTLGVTVSDLKSVLSQLEAGEPKASGQAATNDEEPKRVKSEESHVSPSALTHLHLELASRELELI